MKEMVFAGSGGQGVLTCGLIMSDIAVSKGMNATWSPSYGSAMRGGTTNCTVKYGDDYIYNPQQEQPDVLLAMNEESFRMFMPIVAPGGICVISDMVTCDTNIRDDVTVVRIPCMQIADEIGNPKGANIIMTGAIIHLVKDFTKEEAIEAMNNMFAKKGKAKFAESNTKALTAGYDAVKD